MALDKSNISRGSVGPVKQFAYISTDAIATIVAADYFLGIYEELSVGDQIFVTGSSGGTPTVDVLVVATSSSAGVTVVNGT